MGVQGTSVLFFQGNSVTPLENMLVIPKPSQLLLSVVVVVLLGWRLESCVAASSCATVVGAKRWHMAV